MIKKKPTKKHAKKKAVKKVSGVHKDNKSHNVKINVLSGVINFETLINNRFKYPNDIRKYKINVTSNNEPYLEADNNYFANIDKITKNYFTAWTFIFGKEHKFKIFYKNIVLL